MVGLFHALYDYDVSCTLDILERISQMAVQQNK